MLRNFRPPQQNGGRQHDSAGPRASGKEISTQYSFQKTGSDDSHTVEDAGYNFESIPDISVDSCGDFPHDSHTSTQVNRVNKELPRGDTNTVGMHEPSQIFSGEHDIIFDVSSGFDRYSNYAAVHIQADLQCETNKCLDHCVNSLGSQFNIHGWYHELSFENDDRLRNYLWFGVTNGFLIVDEDSSIPSYECRNYKSVETGEAFEFVNSLILSELSQGKYRIAREKRHSVHSLGAVPKKGNNKWRPITDCKRPIGDSINSFMSSTFRDFCYTTVDNVIELVTPGCFMSTVDIQAAYLSVLVHPTQWKFQGISWPIEGKATYLYDTHVCFGLRCAPYLFTQISNFVLRCLQRRGFKKCAVYLDDFILLGDSQEECRTAQLTFIEILRSLGFYISWSKCVAPTQCVTYLGVNFNSCDMSVSLPLEKLDKLQCELSFFANKRRATKKQIQHLCGILAHCAKVVKGGRTFSHRVISLLRGWPADKKRISLGNQFKHDVAWWTEFAETFNGKRLMITYNYGQGPWFFTDSSFSGYGLWSGTDWQAGFF